MITHSQFEEHAARLFVKPEDVKGKYLHACVGVAGEAGELLDAIKKHWIYSKPLDRENILEECGDLLFYLSQAARVQGVPFHQLGGRMPYALDCTPEKLVYSVGVTFRHAGDLLRTAEEWYFSTLSKYADNAPGFRPEFVRLYFQVEVLLLTVGFTMQDAFAHNIEKLVTGANARYKNGYTDEAAIARADKVGEQQ